jgi:hypothetical protein
VSGYNCSPVTGGCDESFASLSGFDAHLVPHMERPADCRDTDWLEANGYGLSKFNEWFHRGRAALSTEWFAARKAVSTLPQSPRSHRGGGTE